MLKHFVIYFFVLFGINSISQNEYFFFFRHGTCLFAETEESIEIDFDSPTENPDSVVYIHGNNRETIIGYGSLKVNLTDTGTFHLSAEVYNNGNCIIVDSSYKVAKIPKVVINAFWKTNSKKEDVIDFKIYDLQQLEVSEQYDVMTVWYKITDVEGNIKFEAFTGAYFNLTTLENMQAVKLELGDRIELTYIEIRSIDLSRSFIVESNIVLNCDQR